MSHTQLILSACLISQRLRTSVSYFNADLHLFSVLSHPQDQIAATVGSSGAPSTTTVVCMIFALLLVNGICYTFLLHVFYRVILQSMGYDTGRLPSLVKKYLFAGAVDEPTPGVQPGAQTQQQ